MSSPTVANDGICSEKNFCGYWLYDTKKHGEKFQELKDNLKRCESMEMDKLKKLSIPFSDSVLIVASAFGCVNYCNNLVLGCIDNKDVPDDFIETIKNIFFPNFTISKTGKVDTSRIPPNHVMEELRSKSSSTTNTVLSSPGIKSSPTPITGFESSVLQMSPNSMILFFGQTLLPSNSISNNGQFIPSWSSSPTVNHRTLRVDVIWSQENIMHSKNTGMLGFLYEIMNPMTTFSLDKHDYFVWPYSVVAASTVSNSHIITASGSKKNHVHTLFAHARHLSQNGKLDLLLCENITAAQCQNLLTLLQNEMVVSEIESDGNSTIDTILSSLLSATMIISTRFGNLTTEEDWLSLLSLLLKHFSFGSNFLELLPRDDLISVTVLLFQSLCPIRFGFLDGQSRIVSTAFYLRKVFPLGLASMELLEPLSVVKEKLEAPVANNLNWSISKTGGNARCQILLPLNMEQNPTASCDLLDQLFEVSKSLHDAVTNIKQRNLSDAILYIIRKHLSDLSKSTIREMVEECFSQIINLLGEFDKLLAEKLFPNIRDRHELARNNGLYHKVASKNLRIVFPNLKTLLRDRPPEALALMFTIGSMLICPGNLSKLERCINTEWKVPILSHSQIYGLNNITNIHNGTYIGSSMERDTYFTTFLYQPLIPCDVESNIRSDGFMVTTFYGPVFMLAKVWEDQVIKDSKKFKMPKVNEHASDIFSETFLGVSKQLLQVFCEYGMVIPIPLSMKQKQFDLYRLLVPNRAGHSDLELYSGISWHIQDHVSPPRQKKGWSNIPIMVVVIAHMLKRGILRGDPTFASYFSSNRHVGCFELGPNFLICTHKFSLLDIIRLIVLGITPEGVSIDISLIKELARQFEEELQNASKEWIYSNLQNCFNSSTPSTPKAKEDKHGKNVSTSATTKNKFKRKKNPVSNNEDSGKAGTKYKHLKTAPNSSKLSQHNKTSDSDDSTNESEDEQLLTDEEELTSNNQHPSDERSIVDPASGLDALNLGQSSSSPISMVQDLEDNGTLLFTGTTNDQDAIEMVITEDTPGQELTSELYNHQFDVPNVYVNRPPTFIDLQSPGWYWSFKDQNATLDWSYLTTIADVNNRVDTNIAKLVYTQIALEYAAIAQHTHGEALLDILEHPWVCTKPEEIASWKDTLNLVATLSNKIGQFGGKVPKPGVGKSFEGQLFYDFFCDALGRYYPDLLLDSNRSNKGNTTNFTAYWSQFQVTDHTMFNLDMVWAQIHTWKCSILFDTICRSYFYQQSSKDLSDALFGSLENKNIFPISSLRLLKEWEYEFNMLTFHLDELIVHGADELWVQKPVKKSFLHTLRKTTGELLQASLISKEDASSHLYTCLTDGSERDENTLATPAESDVIVPAKSSRPTFVRARVSNKNLFTDLHGLFFQHNGLLRRDLKANVTFEPPHGFILFDKHHTKDVRWFITLKRIFSEDKDLFSIGYGHCLFNKVGLLLVGLGLLDPQKEYVRDVGLIVGGLVTQPIHFDVPEETSNRHNYKDVLELPNAPASLLLGLGSAPRIAIRRRSTFQYVHNASDKKAYCSVIGGNPGELFKVVGHDTVVDRTIVVEKQSEKVITTGKRQEIVILESDFGFLIRGDFPHGGAPIMDVPGEQMRIWSLVQRIFVPHYRNAFKKNEAEYEKVYDKLCDIESLDKITRLHVMIFPKDVDFDIPDDRVGYDSSEDKNEDVSEESCKLD